MIQCCRVAGLFSVSSGFCLRFAKFLKFFILGVETEPEPPPVLAPTAFDSTRLVEYLKIASLDSSTCMVTGVESLQYRQCEQHIRWYRLSFKIPSNEEYGTLNSIL